MKLFFCNHGWRTLHQPNKDLLTFMQSNVLHEDPIKTFLRGRPVYKFFSIVPYLLRRDLNHLYLLMSYSCDRFAADKCLTLVGITMNKWCPFFIFVESCCDKKTQKGNTEERWKQGEEQRDAHEIQNLQNLLFFVRFQLKRFFPVFNVFRFANVWCHNIELSACCNFYLW